MNAEHELRSQIGALAALLGATIGILREHSLMSSEQIEGLFTQVRQVVNVPGPAQNIDKEGWASVLAMAQVASTSTTTELREGETS